MLRWYVLRMLVRGLLFAAGICVCAWYAHAFATSPAASSIVSLVVAIFVVVGILIAAAASVVVFRRPANWNGFTRADFRAQRRIIHAANRAARRHKLSADMPARQGWTLSITYPNRREWPGELWWFIRTGEYTYLRISILCTPAVADADSAATSRSYAIYPLGGPSLKVGNGVPAKPSADDYTWLLDQLAAAAASGR